MSSLVIVAIPSQDDYVHKISSEKVPHMTLLFLGEDASKVKNLGKILDFVGHAADQSLMRFGLDVDRRGVFGPDQADVLFFSKTKWSGFETVRDFRSYLLKDDNIHTANDSADQFPEWEPHLTLGYPDTPAKPDERDYPGINYVTFDRIAVWFADYDGIEFPLKAHNWDAEVAMSSSLMVDAFLYHHGVKGMKWGVRRKATVGAQEVIVSDRRKKLKTSGGAGHPAHTDAVRIHKIGQVGKKSGLKALSDEELSAYAKRINLEQNVKRLQFTQKNPAQKFVATVLGQTGKTTTQQAANDVASQQVRKRLVQIGALAA
jgi:2'-5' RNA ligase